MNREMHLHFRAGTQQTTDGPGQRLSEKGSREAVSGWDTVRLRPK